MRELIFFTSNITKLAHFRHLAKKYGIVVNGFKEKTYRASYDEPIIDDRSELLRLSYLSALKKWNLSKHGNSNKLFFFEDTSVRIDALSSKSEEPGVNVKYWMKGMTFELLDQILKSHGNNRKVSVRSDIVLHIPEHWKEALKLDAEYIWVYGTVEGTITENEFNINTNMVYPWLDSKTFNRWFIPLGADAPLSMLPIAEADQYDFRAIAFNKIAMELEKMGVLTQGSEENQYRHQMELDNIFEIPCVFVICGPSCAGKTTLAQWLTDENHIPHIEASDFMYKAFWERHGLRSSVKIGDFAESALKTEKDIVSGQIAKHILEKEYPISIITGFRSPDEIKILESSLGSSYHIKTIYLEAEYTIRLERALLRSRDNVDELKFQYRDSQEERMGIKGICTENNTIIFKNEASFNELIDEIKKEASFEIIVTPPKLRLNITTTLEQYILLTLLSCNESDLWSTTTEIAALINNKFQIAKSKNNVSRYFNQGYHPYYEVRIRDGKKSLEYRLSATGKSEAKRIKLSFTDKQEADSASQKFNYQQMKFNF
ncbi:non-canonical purine NTP pyrophosphatase [Aquitalea denitrificans]|uniref:non-canonical purine NTP pyrophosphatase n=1 Tax=Aquitalea denitrificans TaxID=519081 RepID=UPI0013571C21|nr:non-canonical purine NTP pyrophosphatase [Aquitalea denitrificans]